MIMSESARILPKRERTRSSLLTATRNLVNEHQHQKISIQDITQEAHVGLGTFYNYFDSKYEIFEAVLDDMRTSFNERLFKLRKPLKDPATVIAVTLRYCFEQALDDEEWRSFISWSGISGEHFLHQDQAQCLQDIQWGARSGRFQVDDVQFTCSLVMGMVRHVTLEVMQGNLHRNAMPQTTRHNLRMLGIPDLVAKALTQASLPAVAAAKKSADGNTQLPAMRATGG